MSEKKISFMERHKKRTLEWGKLFSITASAQFLVQILSFVSGIVIIRSLSSKEYAFYTIANTMLGTMTVLADAGIGSGVISQGGQVWRDPSRLGVVMASGLNLRKKFAVGSLLVATPAMLYLLMRHGAGWSSALLIFAALTPAFLAALSDSLLELAPKLKQDIIPLQRNQIAAAIARIVLTLFFVLFLPYAAVGILAAGASRAWANIRLRKIASKHADWHQAPDALVTKSILQVVRRVLPTSIYYCISGQLTIWLLSIMGTTTAVGQIGALNGLSTMFNVFTVVFTTLIVPRFARLPGARDLIFKRFLFLQLGFLFLSAVIVLVTSLFSKEILWILGGRFAGLRAELVLVSIQSCIGLASASTNQLLSSRGIIVPPMLFVGLAIVAQIGCAFLVHLNQLSGAIIYGILTSMIVYIIRIVYFGFTLNKHEYTF